jgi:hypothetical protein
VVGRLGGYFVVVWKTVPVCGGPLVLHSAAKHLTCSCVRGQVVCGFDCNGF